MYLLTLPSPLSQSVNDYKGRQQMTDILREVGNSLCLLLLCVCSSVGVCVCVSPVRVF